MLPRHDPSPALLALAQLQSFVLSLEQTRALGLPDRSLDRLLAQGRWQRLHRRIVATTSEPVGWLGQAWAGTLLGGPRSRLGGTSAGFLWGLVEAEPTPLTVLVPDGAPVVSSYPITFRRERPGVRDTRSPGQPPRTTVEDTVLDLCDESTPAEVVGWVTTAVQRGRTSVPRLRRALADRSRVRHRRLLTELLADVREGVESALELRYLRDVERAHGLPRGERQHRGALPFLRDVYYRRYRLVVELDGRLGHEGMGAFRDMWRDNLTAISGDTTLRFGHVDIADRPCGVSLLVAETLIRLGWGGLPTRCGRCRKIA